MPAPALSDDLCVEVVAFFRRHGTITAAANAAGIPRATFDSRLKIAAARGFMGTKPVLPGFQLSRTSAEVDADGKVVREFIQQRPAPGEEFQVPEGHAIKGVSALVDAQGRVVTQWIKTREGVLDPLALADALKAAFTEYAPAAAPVPAPAAASEDLLTLLPCNDWHIGMFAWAPEVGANWDLKIAERVIGRAVEDIVARSPASGTAIILGGGDLLHADNKDNQTARSGAMLDVDGRYPKVVIAAGRLMVRTVDAALRQHRKVIVRVLPGNHDEHTAVAIAYFLLAWYRNEPRVEVDVDPSLFFWHRHGAVLLGATHGHTVKIDKMPGIMAHRRAEDWGATKYRYVHGFHLHHSAKIATEGNGVIAEIHQAPVPQDAWHFGSGFLSGSSLQAITYHAKYGEIGRVRAAVLDGEPLE